MSVRGPVDDLVLLTLLVFFFAFEQRRRPEVYFRFWLAGWVIGLLSVLCWHVAFSNATAAMVEKCLQQDAWCGAALAFAFSFLVLKGRWRGPLWGAFSIAIPMCVGIDLIIFDAAPRAVLYVLIAICEALAVWTAYRYLPRGHRWLFPSMVMLCTTCGILLVAAVYRGDLQDIIRFVLLELYAASALLYLRSAFKGGRVAGALGFMAWGGTFALTAQMFRTPAIVAAVYAVWQIPKYIVGVAMVRTIFGETEKEIADLGVKHQRLYEEYRVLFVSNPHPMWIYDAETMCFLAANHAAVAAYGFSETEFLGMTLRNLQADCVDEAYDKMLDAGYPLSKQASRHKRANGTTLDVEVTDHPMVFEGREARFLLAMDITAREHHNRELVRAARHDVLTGLPNRSMLEDRIAQCLLRCVREEKKAALLTVDIDHFKQVNDTFGHLVGDECLKAVGARLSSRVRQVDTIARTGGEEFAVMVGGLTSQAAAEKICQEMLRLFDLPVRCGAYEIQVTVSIGVALFPDHSIDVEGLRLRSDEALYAAKRAGRNRIVFAAAVTV